MAISFSERVTVAPDVLFRVVGEEGVLVNLKTNLYLGLNPVGTRMWNLLGRASSIQEAYDELLQEYEVEPSQLRADLKEFIDHLLSQMLIEAGPARPTLGSRVRVRDDVLFQQSHDEAVLLDPKSGVYFGMDPVGARIWQLLATHELLSDIARTLGAEYDVPADQCAADLVRLVIDLDAHGLVTVS
jgi:hypothetical protein